MRNAIFRRVITDFATTSSWTGPGPNFRGVVSHRLILPVTSTSEWRRFYNRRVPFVPPTVSELPVPFGSWEKNFKRENERYNKHLALGIGFFLFTIFVVSRVATFNFYPPPLSGTDGMDNDLCPPPTEKKCA